MVGTLIGVVSFGCSDASGPTNDTYRLQTVNGEPLPYLVPDAENPTEVSRGSIRLRSNGAFSMTMSARIQAAPATVWSDLTVTATGTYTQSNDTIAMVIENSSNPQIPEATVIAVMADRALTLSDALPGLVLVFRR